MNQLAGADVKSLEGTLEACGATAGLVDGRRSELPACRLRRVTQHVQENLQRELRLAELSALVHMSPYHFARLFKRSTGVPLHRFLIRRLERSRSARSRGWWDFGRRVTSRRRFGGSPG